MTTEYKKYLAFLLIVAAIVLAAGLGLRDPWPADEPRFALIGSTVSDGTLSTTSRTWVHLHWNQSK